MTEIVPGREVLGLNVFFTRTTFQALSGFQSAQALSLPNWDPLFPELGLGAFAGAPTYTANGWHSVLFHGEVSHHLSCITMFPFFGVLEAMAFPQIDPCA